MPKSCFVISPIGEKDSPTRQTADDVYQLIIEPALEKFSFNITRSDKIATISHITSDIVEHIQKSDLCIIDISNHNPNVMYECGRRHETGRPYIMICKEGDHLPFDITTIRTYFYNISSPRAIRETIVSIQNSIKIMLDSGLQQEGVGDSLASVADTIRKIERKIDVFLNEISQIRKSGPLFDQDVISILGKMSPEDALKYGAAEEDVALIDAAIVKIKKRKNEPDINYITNLAIGASAGSNLCLKELEIANLFDEEIDTYSRVLILSSFIQGAIKCKIPERALTLVESCFGPMNNVSIPKELNDEEKSTLLNLYQKLAYAMGDAGSATQMGQRILDIDPNRLPFLYNQIMNLDASNNDEAAISLAERLLEKIRQQPIDDIDIDHLKLLAMIFHKHEKYTELIECFDIAESVSPQIALLLRREFKIAKPNRPS